ncbi:MAG: leucine-rich repeat domain-containing protein [Saprospiraceae bacterium]
MSKKLIIIIVALFAVQISVYVVMHNWEEEEAITKSVYHTTPEGKSLLTKYPDFETREIVYLNGQDLTELPEEILLFKNLKYLHLENNSFQYFPYEVLELEHLEHLFLNNNQISHVNIEPFLNASNSLTTLEINENQLEAITGLENFPNLTHLDLSNNGLTELNVNCPNLTRINLSSNDFRTIPNLTQTQCTFINLARNRIEALDFGQLPIWVEILEVQSNSIASIIIDAEKFSFSKLSELDVSNNNLTLFPNELLKINTLSILKLAQNSISLWSSEDFPINENIVKIDLSGNNLIVLLADLNTFLPNLQSLLLNNNQLVNVSFNHDNLYVLELQNNDGAVCDLKLPYLNTLYCDYEHIETEKHTIIANNLKDLRVYNTNGNTLSQKVTNTRYLDVDVSYE